MSNLFWRFFPPELHLQTTGEPDGSNKQKTAANLAFSHREQFVCHGFIFSIISISLVFCTVVQRKICTFVILSKQFISNYHILGNETCFELTGHYIKMCIYSWFIHHEYTVSADTPKKWLPFENKKYDSLEEYLQPKSNTVCSHQNLYYCHSFTVKKRFTASHPQLYWIHSTR